jgi:hypothetical protein
MTEANITFNNINEDELYNMFNPSISIFDKSIVFCYQKVGTRFFLFLSNWPIGISKSYNQYDFEINYSDENQSNVILNTLLNDYKVSIRFIEEHKNSFNTVESFLENNSGSMNNFFLNNEKDIYFVIRNPKKRFLSGITQVAASYVMHLLKKSDEKNKIKSLTDITDSEIDYIYNNYDLYFNDKDEFDEGSLSRIDVNIFIKIILYIIQHKPNLYYYDAHTKNYLSNYKELIYNIKDKNKVKIIDLEDCKKKAAYELFNTWSDDIDYIKAYNNTKGHTISNKKLYKHIEETLNDNSLFTESLYNFLLTEMKEYKELKNSKYFINL